MSGSKIDLWIDFFTTIFDAIGPNKAGHSLVQRAKNYDDWVLKEKIANECVTQTPGLLAPYFASAAIELGYGWAIRGHAVAAEVSGERMGAFKRRV